MIKINSFLKIGLGHYYTARIDIKNIGDSSNEIKFLHCSDENSLITFPDWSRQEDGVGAVVQSFKGKLNLKIRCINDGKLVIKLRGIDISDGMGNKLPVFINFLDLSVNGKPILDGPKLVSHKNYYKYEEIDVLNDDVLLIHAEWAPFKFNLINDTVEFKYFNDDSNLNWEEDDFLKKRIPNKNSSQSKIKPTVVNTPKVSIIIPVYNPGNLLLECLDSVINQSLTEIEIICVDDGSTDGSLDVLNDYSKKDKRFKIFHQKNKGAGTARNKGIKESTGEFIIFLDSDDWIERDMCEKLYNHAKKLNADLVIFDALWHTVNGIEPFNYFSKDEFNEDFNRFTFDYKFIKNRLMVASYGVIWSRIYKSSYIKKNNIEFPKHKIYNDVEFCFKTAILAKTIAYYPKPFYHYIKLGQPSLQTSFREGKDELIWVDVLQGIYNILIECNLMNEWRLDFINYCIFYSFDKLKNIDIMLYYDFLNKLKSFFEILNPTQNELDSLKESNLTWYSSITFKYLPMFYELMSDNVDGVLSNLFKFKLVDFKNQMDDVNIDIKEEVYESIKDFIIGFESNISINKKLSHDLDGFYKAIITSESYSEFSYLYSVKDAGTKCELWSDVNNCKELSEYSIYQGQPGILSFVDDYKELKVTSKEPSVVRAFSGILNGDFEITFEIKVTDYANIGLSSSEDVLKFTFIRISNTEWLHYKFVRINGSMSAYVSEDGINWNITKFTGNNLDTNECQFQFNCGYSDEDDRRIMLRNMKIYNFV